MSDPKTVVTVHGRTVTFYLSPRDVHPSQITVAKPKHARRIADTIRAVRAERQLTDDSPLYAALVLWAWTGTTKLSDKSWGKYRPQVVRAIEETGSTALGTADASWYERYHQILDDAKITHTHLCTMETALGSFATWCTRSSAYEGARPGGTGHYGLHLDYRGRALARRPADDNTQPIHLRDCPTFAYAEAFGKILGECAVERWGPEYACWRHAPTVQFLTGCRFAELPVFNARNFHLDDPRPNVEVTWQYDDGATESGDPKRKPTKDKRARRAKLYGGSPAYLAPIVAEAKGRPGQLLLPIPHGLATGRRQLHSLYQDAQKRFEERYDKAAYTSHWFRHAYASYALAPVTHGGYAASDREVANSLGHKRTDLVKERYHKTIETTVHFHHLPGQILHDHAPAEIAAVYPRTDPVPALELVDASPASAGR